MRAPHTLFVQCVEELRGEVQPGRRGGHGAPRRRVHRLVALCIDWCVCALDVRREWHVSILVEDRVDRMHALETDEARSLGEHLADHDRNVISNANTTSWLELRA